MRKLSQNLRIPFRLLSDPDLEVISRYGVADAKAAIAVPSVFLIDRDGTVVWRQVGEWVFSRPSARDLLHVIDARAVDKKAEGR